MGKEDGSVFGLCLLDLEAVTEFRSGHPASILQVREWEKEMVKKDKGKRARGRKGTCIRRVSE